MFEVKQKEEEEAEEEEEDGIMIPRVYVDSWWRRRELEEDIFYDTVL